MNRCRSVWCSNPAIGPIPGRTAVAVDWSTGPRGWQGAVRAAVMRRLRGGPIVVATLLLLAAGCSRAPEEQRLREVIAEMQAAAEAREPAAVVEHVSEDFTGSSGLDREQLRRMLQVQMLRNQAIGVTLGPAEIVVDGERATARFVAVTTGGQGGWLPDRARAYRIVSKWRLEDDDWRLARADWEQDDSVPAAD